MTTEKFVELLGMLEHRFPVVHVSRLTLALRAVVEAAGTAGEIALEKFCHDHWRRDQRFAPPPTD